MKNLLALALALGVFGAHQAIAAPIFGAPSDDLLGCDSAFGGSCSVSFDEQGAITASFHSFFFGDLPTKATAVAPSANPAWVDSAGAALQVQSYTLQVVDPAAGNDHGFTPFFDGAVGLCEFDVVGAACSAANDLSDVVLFNYNTDDHSLHIDFLSDHETPFTFRTNFNVVEVGPEDSNGALYHALGDTGGGEDVFYHIISDSVPEPATWAMMLAGIGGLGALLRRRRTSLALATARS